MAEPITGQAIGAAAVSEPAAREGIETTDQANIDTLTDVTPTFSMGWRVWVVLAGLFVTGSTFLAIGWNWTRRA